MVDEQLRSEIREYLSARKRKEEQERQLVLEAKARKEENVREKGRLVKSLVDIFNIGEMRALLDVTGREIRLIEMDGGSHMGHHFSYILNVSGAGLSVVEDGYVKETYPFPADTETWGKVIPYGEVVKYGMGKETLFCPLIEFYLQELEDKIRGLLKDK